ncbi:MAG: deoxyribose-phosphate aldolase [Clostridiales Family XIII bacterium]|nr:deoxyribose-phosphate aldolase [Clostridiales Family XIII bacterium]
MTEKKLSQHIDHTLLKPFASWADIQKLCDEAVEWRTATVCIPPSYVQRVRAAYGERLRICTVIGFPNGYNVTTSKLVEAHQAVADGARDIDMVINISDVKNGDYGKVQDEIRQIQETIDDATLKVIVETCYLSDAEKRRLCKIVSEAKADYIKTSTGFGSAGADLADVKLFRGLLAPNVKIKAAGGIRTRQDFEAFLSAGCDRIGTSATADILGAL